MWYRVGEKQPKGSGKVALEVDVTYYGECVGALYLPRYGLFFDYRGNNITEGVVAWAYKREPYRG